jgi:hypothetical protein
VLGGRFSSRGEDFTDLRLVKDYDIAFVSTGDVLRKEIMAKSEVGKRAEEIVASGGMYANHLSSGPWLIFRPGT